MSFFEITPQQAYERQREGAILIDIREDYERANGQAEGALGITKSLLEIDPEKYLPRRDSEIMLICQLGSRSKAAAEVLRQHGYSHVYIVLGGTTRWEEIGLPLVKPRLDEKTQDFLERYARHLQLSGIGIEGQRRLQAARVLLVGTGGLGSPAAFYLTAAGVGHLRIVDDDKVDRSNLQRQILHTDQGIGMPKVASAQDRLSALNPSIIIEAFYERASSSNIETLLEDVDVVLDGSDNFPARYLLNDACVKLKKPLVYGAVLGFSGQVGVFDAGRQRGHAPCYRCLFPEPPSSELDYNCNDMGVLGVLPGVIGVLQATEVLKLILEIGEPLVGRLLNFDALAMRFRETRLRPDPDCPVCAVGRQFPGYIDYENFCDNA